MDLTVVSSILSCLGEKGIQPNQSFPAVQVDEVLLILGYICVLVQKLRRSHISYYNRLEPSARQGEREDDRLLNDSQGVS